MFKQKSLLSIIIVLFFVSVEAKKPLSHKIFNIEINYSAPTGQLQYHDTISGVYAQLRNEIKAINIGAENPSFNGTVLVAHKGKLIFEQSYGLSNRAIGLKNTPQTPTQIASITKTFTGTSILWLEQRGFLNIKDNVQKYIWDFPYGNITIEQLLSHRSGLPEYLKFSNNYWSSAEPMYNESVLDMIKNNRFRLLFTPGTKFDYCNSNFAVLGLLIERITGMPYKNFVSKYIFEPFNMTNSFVYDPNDTYDFSFAKSYRANFRDFPNTFQDGVYGDKGIFTTVEDLYKWDQALYSNEFLEDSFKKAAFTPTRDWSVMKNYGLGWRVKCYPNGEKYVYHTGWWHGYQGIFARYIKDDFTVIILSNRFISGISKNSEEIYEVAQRYLNLTKLS
ncbi:beta-lactamase family protein [Weeksellaceae bacterium TAE3-ERU29]|nr:beta-lactamase family protein [Weeksellaceae bacterium TAE3-ERU29]